MQAALARYFWIFPVLLTLAIFIIWFVIRIYKHEPRTPPRNGAAAINKIPSILIPIEENLKWGFVDSSGSYAISPKYSYVDRFSEGLSVVSDFNRKYGFVDLNGTEVIPPKYDFAEKFEEGLAMVSRNEKYGFINSKGVEVIPLVYNFAYSFSEGLAIVSDSNDREFFINKNGQVAINVKSEYVPKSFSEGLAVIPREHVCDIIDTSGKVVIRVKNGHCEQFSQGLAVIHHDNGKDGYINRKGQIVIQPKYYFAKSFSENLACVANGYLDDEKYGFIDIEGKVSIADLTQNSELCCR